MGRMYGYIRVSSLDQNEDRQRLEFERLQIPHRNVYMDKQSGKDFNRPQYQRMKKRLRRGDLLVIKSIDRLGRNYHDIQEEWRSITKTIGADIAVLDMPLLDTRNENDLIGTLISDIVLQLLSYVAETERVNIRQRQAEGIAAARMRGVHLGRFPNPIPDSFYPVYDKWKRGLITRKQAAAEMGITPNQFDWMKRKYQKSRGSGVCCPCPAKVKGMVSSLSLTATEDAEQKKKAAPAGGGN